MQVDANTIKTFHPVKVFNEHEKPISGMAFHEDGNILVVSSLDDSLSVYNCETGTKSLSVNSKKYGVGKVCFGDDESLVLHASTMVDNTIRYLSLINNQYIRYFIGHTEQVTSLQVFPESKIFASASKDKTARIWDLRLNDSQGLINFSSETVVTFDPDGLIFAAASASEESVKLFDLRNFDRGPFKHLEVHNPVPESTWHDIKFSNSGALIMVNSDSMYALCFDAFETGPVQYLKVENLTNANIGGAFTPCGKYVIVGSDGNYMTVFEVDDTKMHSGETGIPSSFDSPPITYLQTPNHESAITNIAFNPKYMHLAVASQTLEFWIPDIPEPVTSP